MMCPNCQSRNARRSRRRSLADYLYTVAGVFPWRCKTCDTRFYARHAPFRTIFYAQCKICGNLELQRISAEYVSGAGSSFGRLLGIPALRCEPCRNKFFSIRPLLRQNNRVPEAQGQ